MAVGDAHVFPGFLTPVLTQLFFPKPQTTFLTCFCRGERRKYAGKKSRLYRDRIHNHQVMSPTRSPPSHPGGATHFLSELFTKRQNLNLDEIQSICRRQNKFNHERIKRCRNTRKCCFPTMFSLGSQARRNGGRLEGLSPLPPLPHFFFFFEIHSY